MERKIKSRNREKIKEAVLTEKMTSSVGIPGALYIGTSRHEVGQIWTWAGKLAGSIDRMNAGREWQYFPQLCLFSDFLHQASAASLFSDFPHCACSNLYNWKLVIDGFLFNLTPGAVVPASSCSSCPASIGWSAGGGHVQVLPLLQTVLRRLPEVRRPLPL